MRNKLYVVIGALLLLPSCFFNNKQKGNKHTFFIQAILNSDVIKKVQEATRPLINAVIEEELGIVQDKSFPIFFPKKRQAVTVYYINDLCDNNEDVRGLMYLFVDPVLDSLEKPLAPKNVSFSSKIKFFGQPGKGILGRNDLVALIDDPSKELSHFNKKIKEALHHNNKEYKRACNVDLYDIKKSERHAYLPHISIGSLRTNYIKYLVNDASKADKVLERIKQRIIKVISDAISNLTPNDRKLSFDKLAIYNAKRRKYARERVLEQK